MHISWERGFGWVHFCANCKHFLSYDSHSSCPYLHFGKPHSLWAWQTGLVSDESSPFRSSNSPWMKLRLCWYWGFSNSVFSFIADKSLGRLWAQGCINDLCASCLCKSKTNIKYVGQEQENYGQHCLKREISATWVWDWERRDPCFPLARVGLWVPLTQHLHFFSIASI